MTTWPVAEQSVLEQHLRDLRGFAGAGGRLQHEPPRRFQRGDDVVLDFVNGQAIGHGNLLRFLDRHNLGGHRLFLHDQRAKLPLGVGFEDGLIILGVADFVAVAIEEFELDADAKSLTAGEVVHLADGVDDGAALVVFQGHRRNAESGRRERIGGVDGGWGVGFGDGFLPARGHSLGSFERHTAPISPPTRITTAMRRVDDGLGWPAEVFGAVGKAGRSSVGCPQ